MSLLSVLLGEQLAEGEARLPASDTTFVYPVGVELAADTDSEAVAYLAPLFDEGAVPQALAPLLTTGDGNCAVHAVSRALWGVEIFHGLLRDGLLAELLDHTAWYRARFALPPPDTDSDEWDSLLATAGKDRAQLGFMHLQALANAIRRPIVVLAGPADIAEFGTGEGGVAATLLPLRHAPSACCAKLPVVLAWSTEHKNHFVPLVAVEGQPRPAVPDTKVAFAQRSEDEAALLAQYVDYAEPPRHAPAHHILKGRAQEQRRREAEAAARLAESRDAVYRLIETCNVLLRRRVQEALLQQRRLAAKAAAVVAATAQRYEDPEDGTLHDIVVPVQLGKSVAYACSEYGADHSMAAYRFLAAHGLSMRFLAPLASYLTKAEQVFLAGGGVRPQGLAPGDVSPLASVPSETASAVLVSLSSSELPWKAPVRFDKRPSKFVLDELLLLVTQKGGNAEAVKKLVADAERFIAGMCNTTTPLNQLFIYSADLFFALTVSPPPFYGLELLLTYRLRTVYPSNPTALQRFSL